MTVVSFGRNSSSHKHLVRLKRGAPGIKVSQRVFYGNQADFGLGSTDVDPEIDVVHGLEYRRSFLIGNHKLPEAAREKRDPCFGEWFEENFVKTISWA